MSSSQGYADRLSDCDNKGELNLRSEPEHPLAVLRKAEILAERIRKSNHVVVHTGAGISTSAGINDFRGPNGVWTKERQARSRKRPRSSTSSPKTVSFEDAVPTMTHMALTSLQKAGFIKFVVSQNVDCLHIRSGLPREALSELHGNLFGEQCEQCHREYIREYQTNIVGLRETGNICDCGKPLLGKALDWKDALPEPDFPLAQIHSAEADLNVVLGTSCQMDPARGLPFRGKGGKNGVALVNLSRTQFDERFGLRVRADCDTVFAVVMKTLRLRFTPFERNISVLLSCIPIPNGVSCSLELADQTGKGQKIPCIQRVQFSSEDIETPFSENAPYSGQLDGDVSRILVDIECHNNHRQQLHLQDTEAEEFTVITAVKDWNQDAEKAERELRVKSKVNLPSAPGLNFYTSSTKRGWSMCCLCRKLIFSGRGRKREVHVAECIRKLLIT